MRRAARLFGVALAVVASALFVSPASAADDTGWVITSFAADIRIQSDGRVLVEEAIDVDFGSVQRHGIFRDVPVVYDYPSQPRTVRVYELQVLSVRDGSGAPVAYATSRQESVEQIKIGDPARTVSGVQHYRVAYLVAGALNAFADHDELFWNATGGSWSVPMNRARAVVAGPAGFSATACYVGAEGSRDPCAIQPLGTARASFTAPRALAPGQQLTIVVALPKGAVPEPRPILQDRGREPADFFEVRPAWIALGVFVAIAGLALVIWRWWSVGRDVPDRVTIVPEYEPPDKLRPAEIGVLVDERADTLDVTASIVDLAVRGYLTITEIPKQGIFGSRDWTLTRVRPSDGTLRTYERTILDGLFDDGPEVRLSALRRHFYTTLGRAERELYAGMVSAGYFPADPSRVRTTYAVVGVVALVLAGVAAAGLGLVLGAGIVGLAAAIPALALIAASPAMPRRSRAGAELTRRSLGFRRYMEVAETDRQRFAEKEHIFSDYLPYAIVFGCVDQWAKTFAGIDLREATSTWYTATSLATFNALDLSHDLSSFSNQVSTAIASTPGGSGASGFGGGAGGGGGGGGGGSW